MQTFAHESPGHVRVPLETAVIAHTFQGNFFGLNLLRDCCAEVAELGEALVKLRRVIDTRLTQSRPLITKQKTFPLLPFQLELKQ